MEDIELIAKAVADEVYNRALIPVELDLWSSKEIAAYLKRDIRVVREKICIMPGFPQAIRIPSPSGGKGHPLWKAAEIIDWATSFQESTAA